jgi:hypothetical protein
VLFVVLYNLYRKPGESETESKFSSGMKENVPGLTQHFIYHFIDNEICPLAEIFKEILIAIESTHIVPSLLTVS